MTRRHGEGRNCREHSPWFHPCAAGSGWVTAVGSRPNTQKDARLAPEVGGGMNELLFLVEEADDGSFRAQAVGEAIHTQAETLEELRLEIRDAVQCHFEEGAAPALVRLHHVRQELAL